MTKPRGQRRLAALVLFGWGVGLLVTWGALAYVRDDASEALTLVGLLPALLVSTMLVARIVEDHPLFRDALESLLDGVEGINVVGAVSHADEAVERAADADVIVMDLVLATGDGVTATKLIRSRAPDVRVLVLTSYDDDTQVFAALRAGAHGYLLKSSAPEDIAQAVIAVGHGKGVFETAITDRLTSRLETRRRTVVGLPFPELTLREHEVLDLIARGLTNAEIAETLVLTVKTVRNVVSTVLTKLGTATRAQAVAKARDAGLGIPETRDTDP